MVREHLLYNFNPQIYAVLFYGPAHTLSFIPILKKGNAKNVKLPYDCAHFICKFTPKILQARLQQYVNWELQDVRAGFRKGRGTRNQIANIRWIIEKAKELQKNIYFCLIDNKLWKILKEMRILDHLTCLLRNLYAGQKTTVRTRYAKTDWFKIGKGVCHTVYCHPFI